MVGDINIDLLKDKKSELCEYLNTLAGIGIGSTISVPTRKEVMAGRLVSSCIDHISVRQSGATVKTAVISQELADHYFVGCQTGWHDAPVITPKDRQTINIIDKTTTDNLTSSYDWNTFLVSVSNTFLVSWSSAHVYAKFVDVHNSFMLKAQRAVTVRERTAAHVWLNANILAAIKDKEK